jgi:Spy/CpxP family protein refolding chaperone
MFRRIALPAMLIAVSAAGAVAQNPQPAPQNHPYPQASPQQNPNTMSPADSQQIQGGKAFAQQRLETLLQGFTLTADQRSRVDSIMKRYGPDFPAGSPENATDSALIQRWNILLPRLDNEVRQVLTPGQQATFDSNVEQMRLRRRAVGDQR